MEASLPKDEAQRLEVLHRYELLDTSPEPAYDDVTFLASKVCQTPAAALSLVDARRQWFKSRIGLDMQELPRTWGFWSDTILQKDLLLIPDTHRDPRVKASPLVTASPPVRFYAGAPVVTPFGHAVGALGVIDHVPRTLVAEQRAALQALARQVVAHMELRRHVIELGAAVAQRDRAESRLRNGTNTFRSAMASIPATLFELDREGVIRWEQGRGIAALGRGSGNTVGRSVFDLYRDVPPMIESVRRALLGETQESILELAERSFEIGFAPQRDPDGSVTGVIGVAMDVTALRRYERRLELYQKDLEDLNAKLRERADLDGLTGLHNRRAFEERIEEEISRSARHGIPLSLLMLDVDHFKALNDTLGHTAGDRVLQALSDLLRDSARTMDFVSRYGGEEFAIILPHTGVEASHLMAERLRRVVESAPWPVRQVTVSLGIATLTPTITDARTLLESADRALYHSKQAGRNRVSHVADVLGKDAAGPEVAPE